MDKKNRELAALEAQFNEKCEDCGGDRTRKHRAAPARADANDETFGGFFTAGAFSRDDVLAFRRKMREDFEQWGRCYKRQTNRPRRPLHCFMMSQETPV